MISQIRNITFAATILLALQASGALAHHSRAEFSEEIQVIEGQLVSVKWANPHPTFELTVTNADGSEEAWEVQGFGSLYTLSRGGCIGGLLHAGRAGQSGRAAVDAPRPSLSR